MAPTSNDEWVDLLESQEARFGAMTRQPRRRGSDAEPQPAACFQSSRTYLKCRTCGERPDVIHIPTRHIGYFCGKCCPACPQKRAAKE